MTFLLRYWPYIALVVLLGLLWGSVGYLKAARKDAAQATTRAVAAETKLAAAEVKRLADEKLLADREAQRILDAKRITKLERNLREFTPNETCLSLDARYDWLAPLLLLPDGDAVQPPGR